MATPHPQPHAPYLSAEEAAQCRKLFCRHANGCIEVSIAAGWSALSCTSCDLDEPELPHVPMRLEPVIPEARAKLSGDRPGRPRAVVPRV